MLTNLKGKILNVSKSVGLISAKDDNKNISFSDVNVNAGAELLLHFQNQWAELHQTNEVNAKKGEEVAEKVTLLHLRNKRDHDCIVEIIKLLTATPTVSKSVENCFTQVQKLYESFESVEQKLQDLENLIETTELQQKKNQQQHQLALHQEKQAANLQALERDLVENYSQNIVQYEMKRRKMLEERQQVFEEAFHTDLEEYKSLGTVPKIETPSSSSVLEDIHFDCDQQELNAFLEEN